MASIQTTQQSERQTELLSTLTDIVGAANATTDVAECEVFSQDIFSRAPHRAEAVVAPRNINELSRVVAAATGCGRAVFPRGGGVSYTGGYLASVPQAVVIDLTQMDHVLEINTDDMFVRVEPGVTWAALYDALRERGVRTPFWGVQSGRHSTVGGAMAQHGAYYGSGIHGASGDSVLALTVVLADGQLIRTGSAAIAGVSPFSRYFGPDMTGIFLGDNGALGIKGEITLRLIALPENEGFVSATFSDFASAAAAMSEAARLGLVADGFMMDPGLQAARMKRVSFAQDLGTLGGLAKNSGGLVKGLKSAARVALAGRNIVGADDYSIHLSCEHRYKGAVEGAVKDIEDICSRNGGTVIENSVPKVVRANPFGPLNIVIGTEGNRWIPTHGVVPHSKAAKVQADIEEVYGEHRSALDEFGVGCALLSTVIGAGAFLIEPILTWPDEMLPFHERLMEPSYRKRIKPLAHNPRAGEFIVELRSRLKAVLAQHGATHMQIGRAYPFKDRIGAINWELLSAIKQAVDPRGLMNPGALGLGSAKP
jgi:FAD/FMN-containing dehydrogenase